MPRRTPVTTSRPPSLRVDTPMVGRSVLASTGMKRRPNQSSAAPKSSSSVVVSTPANQADRSVPAVSLIAVWNSSGVNPVTPECR